MEAFSCCTFMGTHRGGLVTSVVTSIAGKATSSDGTGNQGDRKGWGVSGGVSGGFSVLVAKAASSQSCAPSSCAAIPWCLTHISAAIQVLKSLGELLVMQDCWFMREHQCFVTWELHNSWPECDKGRNPCMCLGKWWGSSKK